MSMGHGHQTNRIAKLGIANMVTILTRTVMIVPTLRNPRTSNLKPETLTLNLKNLDPEGSEGAVRLRLAVVPGPGTGGLGQLCMMVRV